MSKLECDSVQGVLFDLDGVLYVGDRVIDGTKETLNILQARLIPHRFITNTSTKSAVDVADKLLDMGIEISVDEIFSAVTATRDYLRGKDSPSVHLLIREEAKAEFAEFKQDARKPHYVVVGDIGATWNYELLNRVFNELMQGAELIAMHMNKYWQTPQGLQMDIGAFVAGLEFVTGKSAVVIGKPSQEFFQLAAGALGVDSDSIIVVGDDIENDIGGAQAAGLKGVLVKTGKYRQSIVDKSEITPDAIIDSIAELPALLSLS